MQITSSWFAVELEGPDFVRANFFAARAVPGCKCYDKLGNRDLIDDSVATQNIETGFVSSTGMFTRRKMFDWGGACRLILLANSIALTEETVQVVQSVQAVQSDR